MEQDKRRKSTDEEDTPRGPLGDVRPEEATQDHRTGGGQPQEDVADRPVVGTVKPEDYPEQF